MRVYTWQQSVAGRCTLIGSLALATCLSTTGVARASASKCPAPAPFHYERWTNSSLVVPDSGIQTFTYQINGLPNHKHYKSGVAEWDARSGPTLPGSGNRRFILLWLRSTGGNWLGFNWAMALKKSGADEIVSQVELTSWTGVLNEEWAPNTLYHFKEEWDAEAGTFTCTVTNVDDGVVVGSVQRAQEYSFFTDTNKLQIHIGWDVDGSDGYHWPPYGWEFSNYTLDLVPGGPYGSLAPECPGGLDWVTTTLPDGDEGLPYGPAALDATAGDGNFTFSVEPNTVLPVGLSVDASGALAGVPQEAGQFTITLRVTDGNAEYISRDFDLVIAPAPNGSGGATGAGGDGLASGSGGTGASSSGSGGAGAGSSGSGGAHSLANGGAGKLEGVVSCSASGRAAAPWGMGVLLIGAALWRRRRAG